MKIPFWGTIFMVMGVIILCALGTWQIKRAAWKGDILRSIEQEYEVDAADVPLEEGSFSEYSGFKRGYFLGRYIHPASVFMQPFTHEGVAGYHVLTPFEIKGGEGRFIMVNRGWIPVERERSPYFLMTVPPGEIKITGMLRRPPKGNAFTPENNPVRSIWYKANLGQMSDYINIPINQQAIFYVENEGQFSTDDAVRYPVSVATRVQLSNNHIQYAFFWFSMAVLMVVIYGLRFFRPKKSFVDETKKA